MPRWGEAHGLRHDQQGRDFNFGSVRLSRCLLLTVRPRPSLPRNTARIGAPVDPRPEGV
jgi:hypothetical protein